MIRQSQEHIHTDGERYPDIFPTSQKWKNDHVCIEESWSKLSELEWGYKTSSETFYNKQ